MNVREIKLGMNNFEYNLIKQMNIIIITIIIFRK